MKDSAVTFSAKKEELVFLYINTTSVALYKRLHCMTVKLVIMNEEFQVEVGVRSEDKEDR